MDEAVGMPVSTVVVLLNDKGETIEASQNDFITTVQSGKPIRNNKAILLNRSKKQLPINLKLTPILDSDGNVNAVIAIFRDVSEERQEERQRADFISTASHEMRTPVAAIEGYLSLALNDKVATIDNRAKNYLEKAHASTQHLGQLFQDLLTSAKAEDGRLVSHPSVVELGQFLEQLTNDLRFIAEKKGLEVDFVAGSNSGGTITATQGEHYVRPLYFTYVDADRMREVITNLFDNAVKYTPSGKITLGITGNEKVVQCSVKDTGPGIPSNDIPHLFQKFYRVDNSATRTIGGTGLGLFICRKIVELYEGRLWVESEVDKGSEFYINLPRLSTDKASELNAKAVSENAYPATTQATA
jgi:signal transduction histidine kinase